MTFVRDPTFRTMPNSMTIAITMATSDEGIISRNNLSGIFGKNSITSMLVMQIMSIHINSKPDFHSWVASSVKGCNWAMPITMARPLQKPIITGAGNRVMKRARFARDTQSIRSPASMTDGNRSSTPWPLLPVPPGGMKVPMMAAKAPVAPLTMPGRPPKTLQMRPTIHAACNAMGGLMWAMKANATDSGICAKQIVMPRRTSLRT
mmetsp:Transcript_57270/g.174386  ORF Transcript_57270/g.174386 Transcript_57270/m.174386 type:complete len:206 (+) Transcript_57270:1180-1797(+)